MKFENRVLLDVMRMAHVQVRYERGVYGWVDATPLHLLNAIRVSMSASENQIRRLRESGISKRVQGATMAGNLRRKVCVLQDWERAVVRSMEVTC